MVLAIFLVSLLAVGAVSAADNSTGDIVGMDDSTDASEVENDLVLSVTNDTDNFEVGEVNNPQAQTNNEEIISADSKTSQDILEVKPGFGKDIFIDDVNIGDYFTSSGDIIPDSGLVDGDTIIFGNLNDKILNIDIPLLITSNGTGINENTINLKPGSDNSIIQGLVMANNFTNAINVEGAENVSIVKNMFSFYSLGRNNHLSAITADSIFYLTIAENEFKYIGKDDDDGGFNSNTIINIIDSDIVEIVNNTILFDAKSAAQAASDRAIKISYSDYLVISDNKIAASIPSREISWATGEVYSECVSLEDCKNVTFAKNDIAVASSGSTGAYDTIYGVHIVGENVTVYDNVIDVVGAPYGYGLVIFAENFKVFANSIFTGINWTSIINGSSSLFNSKNYFDIGNFTQAYEKLVDYYDAVKGNLKDIDSDIFTPYACSVEIDGKSSGVIEFNLIGATAVSPYGIYAANWAGDVKLETGFNLILGVGNSAFGMSLTGSEALVKYSLIAMLGNFTTGIASSVENINITHNAIYSRGSNEGTPMGYDMMGIETTGVHIVGGTASITKNIMNATGECTVDLGGDGRVTENILVANVYTGDASVNYAPRTATVKDNTPKMQKIKMGAKDVDASYGENIKCYVNVTDYDGYALREILVQLCMGNNIFTNKTDKNGVATFNLGKINVGSYDVSLATITNSSYVQATKTVKIAVSKATPKVAVKSITFKDTDKSKKYTVTLKDNMGNSIKGAKVTLKVDGKTYTATTNGKGVATFYLKKLIKTGKYTATITYPGNNKYNKVTKKAKITVKQTWKTISKGSKNHAMVKKIQKALKKNGYYLSYKGHYLKVDGIFHDCTQRSVKEFQKAKGLKVTGKIDYKTAQKLKLVK